MKKRIIYLLFVFFSIALGIIAFLLHTTNTELRNQIAHQTSLIKRSQASDSLSCEHTEKYAATVNKYITNDCSLVVDGKEISLEKFINIYAEQQQRSADLQGNLTDITTTLTALEKAIRAREEVVATTQDSLALYKFQLRNIEKKYGIKSRIRASGNYRIAEYETKQADSALLLLKVFRNRLSYDSLKKEWHIRTH